MIRYAIFDSSIGNILLVSKNEFLVELDVIEYEPSRIKKMLFLRYPDATETLKPFMRIARQLDMYLKGEKIDFDIDVDITGMTEFVQNVLNEVRKIPYGEVRSYGNISRQLGYKDAARAVGQAVGKNPIPIIIPCHRVIREDGSIGGFSMGIGIKKRLLTLEGVRLKSFC